MRCWWEFGHTRIRLSCPQQEEERHDFSRHSPKPQLLNWLGHLKSQPEGDFRRKPQQCRPSLFLHSFPICTKHQASSRPKTLLPQPLSSTTDFIPSRRLSRPNYTVSILNHNAHLRLITQSGHSILVVCADAILRLRPALYFAARWYVVYDFQPVPLGLMDILPSFDVRFTHHRQNQTACLVRQRLRTVLS